MDALIQQSKNAGLIGWWAYATTIGEHNKYSPIFRHWRFIDDNGSRLSFETRDHVLAIGSVQAWNEKLTGPMFHLFPKDLQPGDDPVFVEFP